MVEVSQERLAEFFEYTDDLVFMFDVTVDGRFIITALNPAEERHTGLSAEASIGRDIADILPHDAATQLLRNYRRCVETAEPIHYEETVDLPAGRCVARTTLTPVRAVDGRVHRIIGVAHILTAEHAGTESLRESEARFRELADHIGEVFWMAVADLSRFIYVSPAYDAMWGHSRVDLLSSAAPWRNSIHPSDRERVELELGDFSRRPLEWTYRIRRADGAERWIRTRTSPVEGPDGTVTRVVGTSEDVTEVVKARERLEQTQRLAALGQLAGGIAHDFNNLLTIVQGSADMLVDQTDAEVATYVENIRHASERGAQVVRQLLAFSRRQELKPKMVELRRELQTTERMLRTLLSESVELVLLVDEECLYVRVDPAQLQNVVVNLVLNARDAMPHGGTVTVRARLRHREQASAPTRGTIGEGPHAVISVSDTGTGMSAATMERIFEPFFTTKPIGLGTGLGLAMVSGVVEQSGGALCVTSSLGQGTSFEIWFPISEMPSNEDAERPRSPIVARDRHCRILIVDDDLGVCGVMRSILVRAGYEVTEAQGPGDAVLLCEEPGAGYDLLITDLVMPRMGGKKLAERLRRIFPRLKVIYTSGTLDPTATDVDDSTRGHVHVFVSKPFKAEDLLGAVDEVLGPNQGEHSRSSVADRDAP